MENKVCGQCGAALTEDQNFCPYCGAKYKEHSTMCKKCGTLIESGHKFCHICGEKNINCCVKCGTELSQNSVFCPNCGKSVNKNTKKPMLKQLHIANISLIKRAVILLLAFIMLVSIFLPFQKMEQYYEKISIKFSPIDGVLTFFDFFYECYTDAELEETKLYQKNQKLYDEIVEKYGAFNQGDDSQLHCRYYKNAYRLNIRRHSIAADVGFTETLSFLASLMYIVFTVVFLILALISLLSLYIRLPDYSESANLALTVSPIMIVLMNLCLSLGNKMCATPIIVLILATIILFALALYKIFIEDQSFSKNTVKRAVSLACCVLILFATTIPIFKTEVTTTFRDSSHKTTQTIGVDYTLYDLYKTIVILAKEGIDIHTPNNMAKTGFSNIRSFTELDFKAGKADSNIKNVIVGSTLNFVGVDSALSFSFGKILIILTIIMAAVLLWNEILNLVCNITLTKGIVIASKITLSVCTVLAFVVALVISIIATRSCMELNLNFKTSISFGMVAILIASIFTAILPMKN